MPRPLPPLWLTTPTRVAGLSRRAARVALALLALLLAATLTALAAPGPPPVSGEIARRADDRADVVLYESIVSGVRAGGDYYAVAAAALRVGDYPLRPFITFRLPTLAVLQAAIPAPLVTAMLYALGAAVMLAWLLRLRPLFARTPPLGIALALLAGGMVAFVQPELASFHEIWAGLLIALSLALRRPGRWVEAAAFGMIAMLIRETAVLYAVIMALLAFADHHRREAAGWAAAIAVFAVVVALHARAVGAVVGPLDPASQGWSGLLGFGFFVKAMTLSTALVLAPLWLAAPLVGLALIGWAALPDPIGPRALGLFAAYAALLGIFGRADTFYWGLMVAPTLLLGLAFVPDALRDLAAAALDRRRIVVTRLRR